MRKVTVEEIEVQDRRVLMRVDFNVPLEDGAITNDARIRRALPTINHVLGRGARLVLMSHLGRPKGKVVEELRMDPVAARLAELLGREVKKLDDCVGPDVEKAVSEMQAGDVVVLENLRFNPGEKAGDSEFVMGLSRLGDVYVNDAFGTAHRSDASVAGVPTKLPAAAGLLLKAEIEHLGKALLEPERPFIVALGGAKVSDKIGTVENLLRLADRVLIGGAMAYTFLAAEGIDVGDSKLEADKKDVATGILASARERGVEVKLPGDHVTAREFSADAETRIQEGAIEGGWMGLDIGPETAEAFCEALEGAGTIVWNGTMGVCEMEPFSNGSKALAEKMAGSPAATIVGGGDTLAAVEMLGLQERFDHVSTGGGAFLEFMEGKDLPGVACLPDKTS
jgi:phosphoglycerate kinase